MVCVGGVCLSHFVHVFSSLYMYNSILYILYLLLSDFTEVATSGIFWTTRYWYGGRQGHRLCRHHQVDTCAKTLLPRGEMIAATASAIIIT